MLGVTARLTMPSRSRLRNVSVSMRCDTLGISRRSSLKRFEPSPRVDTTSTVHLSPIRDNRVLMVRQTELAGSFMFSVPFLFPQHTFVRETQKSAFLRASLRWLFRVPPEPIH